MIILFFIFSWSMGICVSFLHIYTIYKVVTKDFNKEHDKLIWVILCLCLPIIGISLFWYCNKEKVNINKDEERDIFRRNSLKKEFNLKSDLSEEDENYIREYMKIKRNEPKPF